MLYYWQFKRTQAHLRKVLQWNIFIITLSTPFVFSSCVRTTVINSGSTEHIIPGIIRRTSSPLASVVICWFHGSSAKDVIRFRSTASASLYWFSPKYIAWSTPRWSEHPMNAHENKFLVKNWRFNYGVFLWFSFFLFVVAMLTSLWPKFHWIVCVRLNSYKTCCLDVKSSYHIYFYNVTDTFIKIKRCSIEIRHIVSIKKKCVSRQAT